jgi:uncharacterized pyridoxamine 5'-phosphate oxidase family protein
MKLGLNQTHIVGLSTQFILVLHNILSNRDEFNKYDSFYLVKNDGVRDISRTNFNNLNMPQISNSEWESLDNWWSSFLDQSSEDITTIADIGLGGFDNLPMYTGMDITKHEMYSNLRNTQKKYFPWSKKLVKEVKDQIIKLGIDENTLAVHIRLSDMTKNSKYTGIRDRANTMEDYVNCAKHILKENPNIKKIFAMGENENLVEEFKSYFDIPVVNYDNCLLGTIDDEDGFYKEQCTLILNPKYWFDTYVDILIGSKCPIFLSASSSVSWNVLIFNEGLKKLYYTNDLKHNI